MKLYLSSYRAPVIEELLALLSKPAAECKVAIIPNAKDYKLPAERALSLDELIVYLGGWSFRCDVIDLREFEAETEVLAGTLKTYDLIWMAGGNTLLLREEMQRSGFDLIVKDVILHGVVYVGESAGAIVAGLSLDGSEIADDPELADETITEGLGLINKIVVPHADSLEYIEYVNAMKKRYAADPNVLYINDNQAFIVNGEDQKIVARS